MASRDRIFLGIILVSALIHGLIYVFLMPPWQHYDEPTHFELAWLIARTGSIPQADDTIPELRRTIAISMRENNFFRDMTFRPPLEEEGKPIWLGLSQIGNLPLYYQIIALPVRWLEGLGVEAQLYGARLVSCIFFLLSVLACWGVVAALAPPGHFLRLLVPLSLALLPGYVDVMTSVNNDSLAACLAALFLWAAVRLVRFGFSFIPFIGLILAAVLAFWSKETAYPIYALLPIVCLLLLLHGRARLLAWGLVASSVLLAGAFFLRLDDAAHWYRITLQPESTRVKSPLAVSDEFVFQINSQTNYVKTWYSPGIFQPVPVETYLQDRENVYTYGAWAWSDMPRARIRLSLGFGFKKFGETFELTSEPTFIAITGTMTAGQNYPFRMMLLPEQDVDGDARQPSTIIYIDGIVLAEGIFPLESPPEFDNTGSTSGSWGGRSFVNLARNASAEEAGPRVTSEVDSIFARFWPENTQLSLLMTSILDGPGASPYFLGAAKQLLFTFWGRFGWGHVPLLGQSPLYKLLALLTVIEVIATLTWLAKAGIQTASLRGPQNLVSPSIFLAIAMIPWAVAILRAPIYLGLELLYLPVARYAYAAIIPTMFALNLGLFMLWDTMDRWPKWHSLSRQFLSDGSWFFKALFGIGAPLLFAVYAIVSILAYYR